MSFRNPILAAGAALGVLLAFGPVDDASAAHYGYGYGNSPMYGYGPYHGYQRGYHGYHHRGPMAGYRHRPMYGGYGAAMSGYGYGMPYAKDGSCGKYGRSSYMMKTGMGGTTKTGSATPSEDIVDIAAGAGSFNTLVAAVKAAGLVDTLKGDGPFTVFAPTDEAFAKIPESDLEALLADKEKLTAVLTYHVVPGEVTAADVAKLDSAETVQGGTLTIDTSDGVKVDDATVVKTDIMASNGVIHVIDTVLMPK